MSPTPSRPSRTPSDANREGSEYLRQVASLNDEQRRALHEQGHTVVLAGPGSGKTKTLVLKIARLLNEATPPRGVACLTYAQEAAREFEARLRVLGIRGDRRLFTGTVHSFCLTNILRPFGHRLPADRRFLAEYEIATDEERRKAREAGLSAAAIYEEEYFWTSKLEAFRRLTLVEPHRANDSEFDERLPKCADVYASELHHRHHRIDFDDIVAGAYELVENDEYVRTFLFSKYPYLLVDEYQDLGLALHRIVVALMERAGTTIFAVGDPDQSIYGWSGARPEFLLDLTKRANVTTVQLAMNYRSGQEIIDASLHVLQAAEARPFRASSTDKGEIYFHACKKGLEEQADRAVSRIVELRDGGLELGEIGILCYRSADLKPFEDRLKSGGIPYRLQRSKPYKATSLTTWVEDVARWCAGGWRDGAPKLHHLFRSYMRFMSRLYGRSRVDDLRELTAFSDALRALQQPHEPLGKWVSALAASVRLRSILEGKISIPLELRHDVEQLAAMYAAFQSPAWAEQPLAEFVGVEKNKVVLQTLHGSKGLQYSVVFLPALEEGVLPKYKGDPAEDRRVFYVGLTRARREVHVMSSGFYLNAKGRQLEYGPSPFLRELRERLKAEKRSKNTPS